MRPDAPPTTRLPTLGAGYQPTMTDRRHLWAIRTDHQPAPASPTGWVRFELTVVPAGDRCTVVMLGTLDGWSSPAVDTQYDQLLGGDFAEVVLDLGGIGTIDESGAVALTQLWAKLRNSGVFCLIRGLSPEFVDNPVDLLLSIRASGTQARSASPSRVPGRPGCGTQDEV